MSAEGKESEVKGSANPEEGFIEVSSFFVEDDVLARGVSHPIPNFGCDEDEGDKKEREEGEEVSEVFELATDNDAPFCIHGVVDKGPKECAEGDGKEDVKGKEPGVSKLFCVEEADDKGSEEGDEGKGGEAEEAAADVFVVVVFWLRGLRFEFGMATHGD